MQSHYTGDTPYWVWIDLNNSLARWKSPIFNIPFSRNSKSSVWKPNFFPRQAKPKILFALHFHYAVDIQNRFWFDLDNSLNRWKKQLLNSQNSAIREIRKIPYEIPTFFLVKLYHFFCYTLSLHWWYSIPRLVWFGQLHNPMKKTFFEIPFSRNSKSSVWNTNFFSDKVYQFFFALESHYTGDTPYRVCFDFDNSLTRWKWISFKFAKIRILRNSQKSVWKPKFFPRQAKPKILFAFHCHYNGDTQHRVWFDLGNSMTRWQLFAGNFLGNFFAGQDIPQILFALHCHYTVDTQYRVWFDLDNSLTRWKRPIFKIPFLRNSKSSVWKPNFFPRQAKPKILFALHCHYTVDIQNRVRSDLDNSLTRWKKNWF